MADPTTPPALGTLAALKARLGLGPAVTAKDPDYAAALAAATAALLGETGLQFLGPVAETNTGTGRPLLFLKAWPVVSVQAITPGYAYPAPLPALDPRRYAPDARYGVRLVDGTAFDDGLPFQVAYTAGLDPANVPADLAAACVEVAAMRQSELGRIGIRSKTLATESISYDLRSLSPSAQAAVDRWTRNIWF